MRGAPSALRLHGAAREAHVRESGRVNSRLLSLPARPSAHSARAVAPERHRNPSSHQQQSSAPVRNVERRVPGPTNASPHASPEQSCSVFLQPRTTSFNGTGRVSQAAGTASPVSQMASVPKLPWGSVSPLGFISRLLLAPVSPQRWAHGEKSHPGVLFPSLCHQLVLTGLTEGKSKEAQGSCIVGNMQRVRILFIFHPGSSRQLAVEDPNETERCSSLCQLLGGKYRCVTCAGAAGTEVSVVSAMFHTGI